MVPKREAEDWAAEQNIDYYEVWKYGLSSFQVGGYKIRKIFA